MDSSTPSSEARNALFCTIMDRPALICRALMAPGKLEAKAMNPSPPSAVNLFLNTNVAIAIAIGGDVTVDAASRIAGDLGMSQTLIGLTIVSIGTSLPELVTSIVAARKNEVDMALGNAIGSNIFNILMVLGVASAISPISIIKENIIDMCVLIVFTVCVWIFAGTKKKIGKMEGFCMVAFYLAYAVYIIIR